MDSHFLKRNLLSVSLCKFTLASLLVLFSNIAFAYDYDSGEISFFYTYETNELSEISGIGLTLDESYSAQKIKGQLTTSFNYATVMTKDGYEEDYLAWEVGYNFGYFSDTFIYAQIGVDLTEIIFNDFRSDTRQDCSRDFNSITCKEDEEELDAYIGLAGGIQLEHLKLEAFSRLRKIDSEYWDAGTNWFSGVKFSVSF
jgi:hypothetical protein